MNKSISIIILLLTVIVITSCKNNNSSYNAKEVVIKDSCLYKAILERAKQLDVNISDFKIEEENDTSEVISSLRKIYYDTLMNAFSQTTKITIVGDSINKLTLSEYLFDSNYYHVIKMKSSGLWAKTKIEGVFMFRNDSGEVQYPKTIILKGPPNILIAHNFDSSFSGFQRKFLIGLIPNINDCRGTDNW